jgi:hypothetical protein
VERLRLAPRLLLSRWRSRVTEEQKREGWEMAMRIEKILASVLAEPHKRQVEEVMGVLSERAGGPV